VVGLFALCWLVSVAVYRLRRFDEIQIRAPAVER
jgi:hypothetical protein